MTISYPGDEDTSPQEVRLRAASQPADLGLERPVIEDGRVKARGTVSDRARGLVRLQVQYVVNGQAETVELRGEIDDGEWEIDEALSPQALVASRGAAARCIPTRCSRASSSGVSAARWSPSKSSETASGPSRKYGPGGLKVITLLANLGGGGQQVPQEGALAAVRQGATCARQH
jgi:hypothetical protein